MERWRFFLARSNDMSHIGELAQARGRNLNCILNRGGSLSFGHGMRHEIAEYFEPITTCVKAYRFADRHQAWNCEWSGPIWTIEEQIHDQSMTVNCIGWQDAMLGKRLLRMDKNYSATDDGEIIRLLLAEANKLTLPDIANYAVPVPNGWANQATPTHIGWGGTIPNEGIGGATAYQTANRNKTYQRFQPIGPAIQELTEYENGCDIHITPEERKLYVYRKRMKVTDQVFGFNWGPNNLQQFSRQIDASQVVNLMQTMGKPGTTSQYADTRDPAFTGWPSETAPDTQQQYGLMEEVANLSDVADAGVLAVYGAGEIYVRYRPRVIYSMTPFPYTEDGSVPEPFVDYTVGDQVFLTAKLDPRIEIENQGVRVFGMSVQIDEEGNERLSALQTSPT